MLHWHTSLYDSPPYITTPPPPRSFSCSPITQMSQLLSLFLEATIPAHCWDGQTDGGITVWAITYQLYQHWNLFWTRPVVKLYTYLCKPSSDPSIYVYPLLKCPSALYGAWLFISISFLLSDGRVFSSPLARAFWKWLIYNGPHTFCKCARFRQTTLFNLYSLVYFYLFIYSFTCFFF